MSKSVLLAVTFFLIGNLVIIGLGINNAAENAKILTRQKMRAVVSLELDYTTYYNCLLYTSPSPRDRQKSRMPSSA